MRRRPADSRYRLDDGFVALANGLLFSGCSPKDFIEIGAVTAVPVLVPDRASGGLQAPLDTRATKGLSPEDTLIKTLLAVVLTGGLVAALPQGRGASAAPSGSGPMLTNQAAFDGRRLFLAGWDTPAASLWDVETGLHIRDFVGHAEGVRAVALSPDGRQLLTGAGSTSSVTRSRDNSVRLWDVATGRELRRFDGPPNQTSWPEPIFEVAFSQSGREVLGVGGSRGLAVWNADTAELVFERPTSTTGVVESFCGPAVMTRAFREPVRLWDYRYGRMVASVGEAALNPRASRCSPDGLSVVIASGRNVQIWSVSTGELIRTLSGHTDFVADVSFTAGGKEVVSASQDGTVRLWDGSSGELLRLLVQEEGPAWRVVVSPSRTRLLTEWTQGRTGRLTNYVSLWDLESGRELIRFDQARRPLGFSPDGRTIPVVDGPSPGTSCCRLDSLLDASTGQPIRRFGP